MSENKYTEKAQKSLEKVVEAFRTGDIAEKCALATYPTPSIPASGWSLNNRWLCLIQSAVIDCRGFRQWKEVGRTVKKGARAVYILRPQVIKVEDEDRHELVERCVGFAPVAVFPAHQTEGEPLDYENLELPQLPLMNVARVWNIEVVPQPFTAGYYGFWSDRDSAIVLCAPETSVFLHELCHASHTRVSGPKTKSGQDPIRELVAELGAEVLRRILGSKKDTSGNTYAYIEHYAREDKMSVLDACLAVLRETAKVVGLILETADSTLAN